MMVLVSKQHKETFLIQKCRASRFCCRASGFLSQLPCRTSSCGNNFWGLTVFDCFDFFFRIFKEYSKAVKYSYPKWLPLTYRIVPQNVMKTSYRNSTVTRLQESADERKELVDVHSRLLQEEGTGVAWIAKISAGAKGEYTHKKRIFSTDLQFCNVFVVSYILYWPERLSPKKTWYRLVPITITR